jgi:hypothetical protein
MGHEAILGMLGPLSPSNPVVVTDPRLHHRRGKPAMLMKPALRRLALLFHLTTSIGWLGGVAAFLVLAITGVASHKLQVVRAAYVAMSLTVSYAIVPLALGSLLTGIISALGTKWGLARYYWVLVKLALTIFAVIVLLVQLEPIGHLAQAAADPSLSITAHPDRARPLIHAAGGMVVLLVVQVLGVYKPWGMTQYGSRRQHGPPTG